MVLTAATCVACFEAVGSIITVALLVAPPAAALLLTRRMRWVMVWAIGLGAAAAVLGHLSALTIPGWLTGSSLDTSTSGMMAVASGVIFLIVAAVSPDRGVLARWWMARRDAMTIALEDALGLLYRLEERGVAIGRHEVESLWGSDVRIGGRLSGVRSILRRRSLAVEDAEGWRLTEAGRAEARQLVRAHRLWETYLAGRASIPASHLHTAAERLEHITDATMAAELQSAVGDAPDDPHGRPIPPAMSEPSACDAKDASGDA